MLLYSLVLLYLVSLTSDKGLCEEETVALLNQMWNSHVTTKERHSGIFAGRPIVSIRIPNLIAQTKIWHQ